MMNKNLKDIAVVIHGRMGSTRIPTKLVNNFAGTTLLDIVLNKLVNSKTISNEQIILTVPEQKLITIGEKYPIRIHKRSVESAKTEDDIKLIHEWINEYDFKYYIMVNACCPLLSIDTIHSFLKAFISSPYPGLFGVMEKKNMFWDDNHNIIVGTPKNDKTPNTKSTPHTYEAAHCLYGGSVSNLKKGIHMGNFTGPTDPCLFVVEEKECFDIDWPWQFKYCEILYKNLIQ